MCQPVAITSRPVCNIQHWQNVDAEAERTLSTVASSEATGATVLYQQQQLHCLHAHTITQLQTPSLGYTHHHSATHTITRLQTPSLGYTHHHTATHTITRLQTPSLGYHSATDTITRLHTPSLGLSLIHI